MILENNIGNKISIILLYLLVGRSVERAIESFRLNNIIIL